MRTLLFFLLALSLSATTLFAQPESNCSDGIDNDNDGLIDCFDPDCNGANGNPASPACADFYYQQKPDDFCTLPIDCFFPGGSNAINVREEYRTNRDVHPVTAFTTVSAGDIVPDNTTFSGGGWTSSSSAEFVGVNNGSNTIYIFDGKDGSLIQGFQSSYQINFEAQGPAIADIDRDGYGDIFIVSQDNRLMRYEFDPTLPLGTIVNNAPPQHITSQSHLLKYRISNPAIADFNEDGTPEVYVGSDILNAIDCSPIIVGQAGTSSGLGYGSGTQFVGFSVAYDIFEENDILPDGNPCGSDCDGLELVTGNKIYAVNLSTNN